MPRMGLYAIPHVVIFANFEPDQSKLSADRWDIRRFAPRLDGPGIEMIPFA